MRALIVYFFTIRKKKAKAQVTKLVKIKSITILGSRINKVFA